MTTSLAALAASSTAHTSSSVLMSTNLSNQNQNTNSPSPVIDITDSNYEIKTEFYTREGLWKLVPSFEYARQMQTTTQNANSPNTNSTYNTLPNTNQTNQTTQTFQTNSNNDPVRISLFKFKKNFIFKEFYKNAKSRKNLCNTCSKRRQEKIKLNKLNESNTDDEDNSDVIFSHKYEDSSDEGWSDSDSEIDKLCKLCKSNIASDGNSESSEDKANDPSLNLMIFNYAREIYTHESAPVYTKVFFEEFNLSFLKNHYQ